MTDNENKPAAVAPCKHPYCNCAWVAGQGLVCEAAPKASAVPVQPRVQLSIDTLEFRELLHNYHFARGDGETYAASELSELIDHINLRLLQAEGAGYFRASCDHENDVVNAMRRAKDAETKLDAIRAGLNSLNRYDHTKRHEYSLMITDENGGWISYHSMLALLEKPE